MTCDDRDEMREDKIRQYMEDDDRTRIEEKDGVRFQYYDGELEEAEIEDPGDFLACHESKLLTELQDEDDPLIQTILSYCWVEQRKWSQEQENLEREKKGQIRLPHAIERIHLNLDCITYLEELIDP